MKKTILIADDSMEIHETIKRVLEPSYNILSVYDGSSAVMTARDKMPNLILLDINMPNKSGTEVITELRKDGKTRLIPVIMLTADAEIMDKVLGFELGADDYVTKPFHILELKTRVESLLRRNWRALSANPLTLLPGGPVIEEEVTRNIRENKPFAFLYIDIDHFKALNDAYGHAQGDKVITKTADIITNAAMQYAGSFVGHIGGDDFIVISAPEHAEAIAKKTAEEFDKLSPSFYTPQDAANGGITTFNRLHHQQKFPLMTVSIAITDSATRKFDHYASVSDASAEIKRYLKARPPSGKSAQMKDRRHDCPIHSSEALRMGRSSKEGL